MTPTDHAQPVCRFEGLQIVLESVDEGGLYCAYNGADIVADNCDTVEEAKEEISAYWAERQARGGPDEVLGGAS